MLLAVMLLSAFSIPAFAGDDNATGGDGSTHPAAEGFGWYNSYQYLYKVNEVPNIAKHYGLDTSVKVHFSSAIHNTTMAVNAIRAVAKR